MGLLILGYLLVSIICFLLIRYINKFESNERDIISFGLGVFVSLLPGANLITIFTMSGYFVYLKYIKPNPSIFAERWNKLNKWFTHGKATDIH